MMKKKQRVNHSKEDLNCFFCHDICFVVDLFQAGKFSKNFQVKPPGELDQVQVALDKLLFMIKHLIQYVDDIIVRTMRPMFLFSRCLFLFLVE